MAAAKHRAIEQRRRGKMLERKHAQLAHELKEQERAVPTPLPSALDSCRRLPQLMGGPAMQYASLRVSLDDVSVATPQALEH